MDLTLSVFLASADGGRGNRQMANITSNIFILFRKAKQKTNAHEATQMTATAVLWQEATGFLGNVVLIINRCTENKLCVSLLFTNMQRRGSLNLFVYSRASSQL